MGGGKRANEAKNPHPEGGGRANEAIEPGSGPRKARERSHRARFRAAKGARTKPKALGL
jgi:hypothetical protein